MPDRVEGVDVLEVLAAMQPGSAEEERAWSMDAREEMLDRVLAEPGGRRPPVSRQWLAKHGWLVVSAAAAVTVAVLLLPGALGLTRSTLAVPAQPAPTNMPSILPTKSGPPSLECRSLDDRERNEVGRINQTYHGAPEDGVVASAAVDAGRGYGVIVTRLTTGQKTAWLTWITDVGVVDGEASYALHLAEITSGTAWDGGPAPYGREALAAALPCVT